MHQGKITKRKKPDGKQVKKLVVNTSSKIDRKSSATVNSDESIEIPEYSLPNLNTPTDKFCIIM